MSYPASHNMYFIAIVCPAQINEKILTFKQWMKDHFGCVVAMRSPAHITLIPPFWYSPGREDELMKTIQSFANKSSIQKIELDGFSHFRKRVLFARINENASLGELKSQVENYFNEKLGAVIKNDDRPFHPHVTIANRDMRPNHFEEAWEHFSHKIFKDSFSSKSICLLKLDHDGWKVIAESV